MVLVTNSGGGGGVGSGNDLPLYYKEINESRRSCRFCLKPVQTLQQSGKEKAAAADKSTVNVQVVRGGNKTPTSIYLDEDEAKKVQQHGEYVLRKLQRIHKSVIWNFVVGRSFADQIPRKQGGAGAAEEVNIKDRESENAEFEPNNPRTWSEESFDFIGTLLKAGEFQYDGFVVVFCVCNDSSDSGVDYDELAWELEKCLTYHFAGGGRSQLIMNEEAVMSRKGLDPVSRKTKTPGKKKSGYCVYLAYQLLDSVTYDQMVGEAVNKCTDLGLKKRQLLAALAEAKLPPQIDEKIRKQVKETREFMTRDQLRLLHRLGEVKEPDNLGMLAEFLTFLKSKDNSRAMGLQHFLSLLNKSGGGGGSSNEEVKSKSSSRTSTLPRPTSSRKPSVASSQQTYSISSRSTTPETPRRGDKSQQQQQQQQRRESSLASIPSSGSASSTPETLRRQDQRASSGSAARKKPPVATGRAKTAPTAASATPPTRRTDSGSRSNTPSRNSVNGDSSRVSSGHNSPRMTTSARKPKPEGKLITREDLRRMNKSYPSPKAGPAAEKKKVSGSFSRTTIPMS